MSGQNHQRGETNVMISDRSRRIFAKDVIQRARNPGRHGVRIPVHESGESDDRFRQPTEDGRGTPVYGIVEWQRFAPPPGKKRKKRPKKEDPHMRPRTHCKRAKGVTRSLSRSAKPKSNRHNKLGRLLHGLSDEPVDLGIEEKPE